MNRHFSKKDIYTDGQQTHDSMFIITLPIIREMQVRPTMRYHLTPVRMANINNTRKIGVGEDVEKGEPSCTVGGNANCCS